MSSLQKFNQTLGEFNQEVEQLKDVSGAYKKLQHLIEYYEKIIKQFEVNNEYLGNIHTSLQSQQKEFSESVDKIIHLNYENKVELEKLLEIKVDIIRKDNKEFYKDLESTIRIKLDDNKSQIKQFIESERSQIKSIFENEFAKNKKDILETMERSQEKQAQLLIYNQKMIKIALWIVGCLNLVLSCLVVFKLFLS